MNLETGNSDAGSAAAKPFVFSVPGRVEIVCCHSDPTDYPEERPAATHVFVPFENAVYSVRLRTRLGAHATHQFGARDIVVIPAGEPHVVRWHRTAGFASFTLSDAFLDEASGTAGSRVVEPFSFNDSFISQAARQLRELIANGKPPNTAYVEAIAKLVAYRVAQGAAAGTKLRPANSAQPLSRMQRLRIERFVADHLDKPISLAALARREHISASHFVRRFAASYGLPPREFIASERLRRARELLAGTRLSVTEIAIEVGMTHSHFSRSFRKMFGLTPTQCRAQQQR